MSNKKSTFPSKPLLPYFQIVTPRNSTNHVQNTSQSASNDQISPKTPKQSTSPPPAPVEPNVLFRSHALDIIPNYTVKNTVEMLQQYQTKPPRKFRPGNKNEIGVHKMHRKAKDLSGHKHTFAATFNNDSDNDYSHIEEHPKCTINPLNDTDKKPRSYENLANKSCSTNNDENKSSRKQLRKINDKLINENGNLCNKLMDIERLMYEKERQLQILYKKLDELTSEEKIKSCETCNEFKKINEECLVELEHLRNENSLLKTTIKQSCKNCLHFENKYEMTKLELDKSKNNTKHLNEDLTMLKTVVFRLNVQLERYQDKLRKHFKENIIIGDNYRDKIDDEHIHVPCSWGDVNTHTLAPLLDAYQDAIAEKDEIIRQYQDEIEMCSGKLKDILNENEALHKKILDDDERLIRIDVNHDETLNDKLQDLLKVYEQKVESMTRDYEQLHKEYHSTRTELCTLQGKYQIVMESIKTQKRENENFIPISVHNSTVENCRRAYDELKAEHDLERNRLTQQIKVLEEKRLEYDKEMIALRTENHELQMNSKSLDKMVKKLQVSHDQQQNQIMSLQISRDSCRRQLQKAFTFSRDLVREQEQLLTQLADKQRESQSLHQLTNVGLEMTSKMDSIRNQFETLQHEAMQSLDSVEQKMNQQEAHISTIKQNFDSEIHKLTQMLNEKDELIKKLNNEAKENAFTKPAYLLYGDKHK
ncbi:putative leucine-rich repeat-containing protein DDB_G0290503 [Chrysoperla carnea]|uniref:putative leucine-rich repeat-containing protein DDB_G0290503 n=1 Tax=Chrysoperla carnea TaxID=189513 RepID=UPI001D0681F5|nr:putative leucine-rich repeat-containing protein DDB_G0290503 [Chrysoperla carnea]